MPNRELTHLINESVRVEQTGYSDWSTQQSLTIATDPTIPSPPTISVVAATESLDITITAPTTNTDGTPIIDIKEYNIYYDATNNIDVTDSGTYSGVYTIAATKKTHPTSVLLYFKVTCVDKWGNESAGSNEDSATPNASITSPEDDGLWMHRIGVDSVWTENTPASGITWSGVVLYWKGTAYTITNGSTTNKYLWWDYSLSTTTFQETDTLPVLTYEDVLVAFNDSGTLRLVIYSPMVIADYIRAGILQSTNWAADVGSQIDLDLGKIVLGGSNEAGFVALSTGAVSMGSDFTWDTLEAIMLGTLKTANSGERIALYGASAGDAHKLIAYDVAGKRIVFNESEIRIYKSDTTTTLSVFPSTPATTAFIGNDNVIVNNTLIIGRDTDPATADILHVTGDVLIVGELVVDDHNEGTTPSTVNVIFYTAGNLPAANTVPRGTIAYQVPV